MEMENLTKDVAKKIIETVGSSGIPPEYGFQFFTAGLDEYLQPLENEYISSFIKNDGSCFKLVIGNYGGGKTHFLYCIRDIAWKHNFVVSYLSLSQNEIPFSDMEKIYRAIIMNIAYPQTPDEILKGYKKGIENFLKSWYMHQVQELVKEGVSEETIKQELTNYIKSLPNLEDISFTNAIKHAFLCLIEKKDEELNEILQWLNAEGYDIEIHSKYKILHKIDQAFAFSLIRSLVQLVKFVGYEGLIILFDEAEQSVSFSKVKHDKILNNLRQIIDECGHSGFKGTMFFYAVPDEKFLEGKKRIYEALKQRLSTTFDGVFNPTGVRIRLERLSVEPEKLLREIGLKLVKIFQIAYDIRFTSDNIITSIENLSKAAYSFRHLDISHKRLFVQGTIKALHILKTQPDKILSFEKAEEIIKSIT